MPDTGSLTEHLKTCPAANAMRLPLTLAMFGAPDSGHKSMHTMLAAAKNDALITEYANAVADEIRSFDRGQIHMRLCDRLGLEYHEFRPFEADDIDHVPSREEAKAMIWDALRKIIDGAILK